jgi:hypothetical protein
MCARASRAAFFMSSAQLLALTTAAAWLYRSNGSVTTLGAAYLTALATIALQD